MDIYSTSNQKKLKRKTIFALQIKVTFYSRVSISKDEKLNSIENQITFFTDMIKKNNNQTFAEGDAERVRLWHKRAGESDSVLECGSGDCKRVA